MFDRRSISQHTWSWPWFPVDLRVCEKTMPNQVPRCGKIRTGSTWKPSRKFMVFVVREQVKRQKVRIPAAVTGLDFMYQAI